MCISNGICYLSTPICCTKALMNTQPQESKTCTLCRWRIWACALLCMVKLTTSHWGGFHGLIITSGSFPFTYFLGCLITNNGRASAGVGEGVSSPSYRRKCRDPPPPEPLQFFEWNNEGRGSRRWKKHRRAPWGSIMASPLIIDDLGFEIYQSNVLTYPTTHIILDH